MDQMELDTDPRGPRRIITAVDERVDGTRVTVNCGHTNNLNGTFTFKVGRECRCFQCGPHGADAVARRVLSQSGSSLLDSDPEAEARCQRALVAMMEKGR